MSKTTNKLARWLLRLSEFVSDIVSCAGIKQQAAEALSPLETKVVDHAPSGDKVLVIIIPSKSFACTPLTKTSDFKTHEELKVISVNFIPGVGLLAGITDDEKAEISTLS